MQTSRPPFGFVVAPLLLAVAAGLAAGHIGCTSTKQDEYRELREYALDENVPRAERTTALLAVARNEEESPHLRAVAVQMLAVLQVEEAQPVMLRILGAQPDDPAPGERRRGVEAEDPLAPNGQPPALEPAEVPWIEADPDIQPARSELLRLEAVIGLGRYAQPTLYDQVLRLVYEDRRDRSDLVVRHFLQSFAYAPPAPAPTAARTAEVLLRWIKLALDRNEDESLVRTALYELRRLTRRLDLAANQFGEWESHIAAMRVQRPSRRQ